MCCLFGIVDYKDTLTTRQKTRLLSALAVEAEARGTDATGVAYNSDGCLRVYKRPWPGRCMRFHIPEDAAVLMGHTRMTTQGNAKKNYNNHPFESSVNGTAFALAHNGVLWNDRQLRHSLALPETRIETDSYIAVQLIQQKKTLDFSSLRYMAEQVEGSFSFTVLDQEDSLYIVKGDSPLTLYHFPRSGVYVYASTEEILRQGLYRAASSRFLRERPKTVQLACGEILKIDRRGRLTRSQFDTSSFWYSRYDPMFRGWNGTRNSATAEPAGVSYLDEIKSVSMAWGYTPEMIDRLVDYGFTPEEIEEILYDEAAL